MSKDGDSVKSVFCVCLIQRDIDIVIDIDIDIEYWYCPRKVILSNLCFVFVWSNVQIVDATWRLLMRRLPNKKGQEEEFDQGDAWNAGEKWFILANWCLKNDTMQIDVR